MGIDGQSNTEYRISWFVWALLLDLVQKGMFVFHFTNISHYNVVNALPRGSSLEYNTQPELDDMMINMRFIPCVHETQRLKMGQVMRKCVLCHMRTTKAQISLRIRAV